MNFKDAYKSYNSEIKANPEILESVLNADSKPRFTPVWRPVFACAAMLAVVVSVSVFSYNTFYREKEPQVRYIVSTNTGVKTDVPGNENTKAPEITTKTASDEPLQDIKDNTRGEIKNSAVVNKPDSTIVAEDNAEHMVIAVAEEKVYNVEIPVQQPEVHSKSFGIAIPNADTGIAEASTEMHSIEAPVAENIGDVMMASETESAMVATLSVDDVSEDADDGSPCYMSYDEYAEYIGLDVNSKAKLPDDMIFEPMPSAKVTYEGDKLVSDEFTASAFSVENPDRNIALSLTKSGVPHEYTNDVSYTCDEAETVTGAHTVVNGVSVSLGVNNVTKEEIDTIINSLK